MFPSANFPIGPVEIPVMHQERDEPEMLSDDEESVAQYILWPLTDFFQVWK